MHALYKALSILILAVTLAQTAVAASDLDLCNHSQGEAALQACTRVLAGRKLDARNRSIVLNIRGNLWSDQGDAARAIADYDQAIRIDPRNAHAHNNRGHRWREQNQHDKAIADYDRAMQLDPSFAMAYIGRALSWALKGEYDRAVADYTRAISIQPGNADLYANRAATFIDKREYGRALTDVEIALRLDPTNVNAMVYRGVAHERMGNVAQARIAFSAALELPRKSNKTDWAYDTARRRLAALNSPDPPPPPTQRPAAAPADVAPAQGIGRRVALVIGNSSYQSVAALANPRRDAETLTATLRSIGFQSVRFEGDLSRERLVNVLRDFAHEASQADWAIVYYAGHGMEMGGMNYIVPVDAVIEIDRDVHFAALPLDQVLNSVEGAKKLRLVILDACRDNPFLKQMRRTSATRSLGRGLARIEPDGGTLVAYAAKHGEVALDGDGQNSPFMSALLKHISTPGVEINKLFRLVRDDVLAATGRKQEPFVYGSLPADDFFFVATK